jgi:serine/threonine-protein kinase
MSRDSENWELLQTLFDLAANTPAEDREQVLASRCADKWAVRRVLEIIEGAECASPAAPSPAIRLTERIGPYSLVRLLGSGGIGTVYLAERILGGAPQRSALKVLAPHAAGPEFVERFHREQHILASLDHPHITRLVDGGLSESGHPYLVMEYVEGEHLDVYCDSHKLSIAQRVELFLQVCGAVTYAHRNLIVHLDLKPSNILVNKSGEVKLLDFGTSKLVSTDSMLTTTVLATPAFASPEQLRNEPVTTACDIYSLGAVLYDLLSGSRVAGSSGDYFDRALNEQEPKPLPDAVTESAANSRNVTALKLRQLLRGDLTTIVGKCLRARPKDRYTSVDALIEDLERYISGRSVLARPQTAAYRIGKFVRRNRKSVALAVSLTLALGAALTYAEMRQHQALREGRRALQMQTFMYSLFRLANSNFTGKPAATVPEFLKLGVNMLPQYIQNPADLRAAQMSLAESMYENGSLDDALKVFTETIASAKTAGDTQAEAESEAFAGNIDYQLGQTDQGAVLTQDALKLSNSPGVSPEVRVWSAVFFAVNRENNGFRSDENLRLLHAAADEARANHLPPHETAEALYSLGSDLELRGNLDEAEPIYNQALQIFNQDPSALCDQSEVYGDLAYLRQMKGDLQGSLPIYQHSYQGYVACSGPDGRGALTAKVDWAGVLIQAKRPSEALPMLEEALPGWRKIAGNSPDLSEVLFYLSQAYVETGRFVDAERTAKELVSVQEGKVASTDRRFGASQMIWAQALAGQKHYREALPHAETAARLLSHGVSPGAQKMDAQAHQVFADIQSKLAN